MAQTTIYTLVRTTRALPLEPKTITNLTFYTDHPDLFTVEELRMGVVMNRTAYPIYRLASMLAWWIGQGFTNVTT